MTEQDLLIQQMRAKIEKLESTQCKWFDTCLTAEAEGDEPTSKGALAWCINCGYIQKPFKHCPNCGEKMKIEK